MVSEKDRVFYDVRPETEEIVLVDDRMCFP